MPEMTTITAPAEALNGAAVGDTVTLKVDSIEDGMATLSVVADETETQEPEPSTISKAAGLYAEGGE